MTTEVDTDYRYIVSIGTEGVEAFLEVTDIAENIIMDKLSGGSDVACNKLTDQLNSMALGFRMNSHRKIRSFVITIDIEPVSFRRLVENHTDVQDLIVKRGVEISL